MDTRLCRTLYHHAISRGMVLRSIRFQIICFLFAILDASQVESSNSGADGKSSEQDSCVDQDHRWAAHKSSCAEMKGLCDDKGFGSLVRKWCPRSCGLCDGTGVEATVDLPASTAKAAVTDISNSGSLSHAPEAPTARAAEPANDSLTDPASLKEQARAAEPANDSLTDPASDISNVEVSLETFRTEPANLSSSPDVESILGEEAASSTAAAEPMNALSMNATRDVAAIFTTAAEPVNVSSMNASRDLAYDSDSVTNATPTSTIASLSPRSGAGYFHLLLGASPEAVIKKDAFQFLYGSSSDENESNASLPLENTSLNSTAIENTELRNDKGNANVTRDSRDVGKGNSSNASNSSAPLGQCSAPILPGIEKSNSTRNFTRPKTATAPLAVTTVAIAKAQFQEQTRGTRAESRPNVSSANLTRSRSSWNRSIETAALPTLANSSSFNSSIASALTAWSTHVYGTEASLDVTTSYVEVALTNDSSNMSSLDAPVGLTDSNRNLRDANNGSFLDAEWWTEQTPPQLSSDLVVSTMNGTDYDDLNGTFLESLANLLKEGAAGALNASDLDKALSNVSVVIADWNASSRRGDGVEADSPKLALSAIIKALMKPSDTKANEQPSSCPEGYEHVQGHVHGSDQWTGRWNNHVDSIEECAGRCTRTPGCGSIEFSNLSKRCLRHSQTRPTSERDRQHFVFCRRAPCPSFKTEESCIGPNIPAGFYSSEVSLRPGSYCIWSGGACQAPLACTHTDCFLPDGGLPGMRLPPSQTLWISASGLQSSMPPKSVPGPR